MKPKYFIHYPGFHSLTEDAWHVIKYWNRTVRLNIEPIIVRIKERIKSG